MKNTTKLMALVVAVAMLFGAMASVGMAEGDDFSERVTLDVVAFVGAGEADGLRTDPVSKYIEEALNIDLYLTHVTEADWPGQLSAMLADNDLPDIFLLSDATKQLPMLIKSNSALALDDYLEQYAPNTMTTPAGQLMVAANKLSANSPDGKLYLWGMCKGSWDDGTVPTCGHYLRWDLYSAAGYPEITGYNDTLLDALEAMVALEPETADGQKTYGLAAWFGAGQDWGEWVFTYGLGPQSGVNLITTTGRMLAVSTVDSKPLENNQLTDPDSIFWTAVQFYNRAYQRGLLDPDSFMMSSDIYEDNLKAGKYMFNVPGWMSANANQEFKKTDPNKMFISLPSINADAEDRFGNMYRGERQYVVNANTEYPERCVALLDFVSSYEFSRIAWNGLEGTFWNMEDGKPVPTDEYLEVTKNDELGVQTGVNVYHHFCGFGNGTIDPNTGVAIDLYQFSDKANEQKLTDTMKDFIAYYGGESQADVYRKNTTTTDSLMFISFGDPEGDYASYVNEINAYMGTNVFKAVAATSDEEFAQIRDGMIADLQNNYHAEETFQYFYDQALAQEADVAMLVEMSNALK
ncbi:MAG: extracellular solute-binding protein [Clostridia bacterium]|nr:extracellular solute-binding protein [Clostridia bacterium]